MDSADVVLGKYRFSLSSSYRLHSNRVNKENGYTSITAVNLVSNCLVTVTQVKVAHLSGFVSRNLLRNLKILSFCDHPNIVTLEDVPFPPSDLKEVYYIQEAMDTNLYNIIRSSQLPERHVAYLMYQLLKAFKYLHSAGITVKCLLPKYVQVNVNSHLKIGQFLTPEGLLSCFVLPPQESIWYKAPELQWKGRIIDGSADMWTAGCILAELIQRKPLFPSSDPENYILSTLSMLGSPAQEDLCLIANPTYRKLILKQPTSPPVSWQSKFPNSSAEALQLISGLLVLNPEKRLTATQCLELPFFNEFRCVEEEIEASECFDWSWDEEEVEEETLLEWVLEAAQRFHPQRNG